MANNQINVFVLEDVPIFQKEIKRVLTEIVFTNQNLEVKQFFTLKDAEKQLQELTNSFDLFILDGSLEPGFGYELIPTIKRTNPKAKIVMCSISLKHNDTGLKNGADMAINKIDFSSKNQEIRTKLIELLN